MFRFTIRDVLWLTVVVASPAVCQASESGDVTMRFVYDGEPPKPQPFTITKDVEVCGKGEQVDESVLVNANDRGLANVLVWLPNDGMAMPVHPSHPASEQAVKLVTRLCRYEPRIVVLQAGQTFIWSNEDPIGHSLHCDLVRNGTFPKLIPAGLTVEGKFKLPESIPGRVACSIHPHMQAYLFVHDNPYVVVSDAHGRLTIKNVPVGRRTFVLWHERLELPGVGFERKDSIRPTRDRMFLVVKPRENDVGEITVSPKSLKR